MKRKVTLSVKTRNDVSEDDFRKLVCILEEHARCERLFPGARKGDDLAAMWKVEVPEASHVSVMEELRKSALVAFAELPPLRKLIR